MCDFLVWYNNCDVKPLLKVIEAQVDIDKLKASVSLPGAAQCWLMATSDKSRHIPGRVCGLIFYRTTHVD